MTNEGQGLSGLRGRRPVAVLVALLFVSGAFASVRSCPHHDALVTQTASAADVVVGVHAGHDTSIEFPDEGAESTPHACLCLDQCELGAAPGVASTVARIASVSAEHSTVGTRPQQTLVSQPTRHLVPLPNAPPVLT